MKPKFEYLMYVSGLTADGVELGPYEQECVERLMELTVAECCLAISPMLRDMISRGQAIELIKQHFEDPDRSFRVGGRVKVIAGFNVGAKGTVNYIEPTGKLWVRRDGASSDVFYMPEEVKVIGIEP
jgi:transcription antitermination factor NusG